MSGKRIITCYLPLCMALFSFMRKGETPQETSDSIMLGMVLLKENSSLNIMDAMSELKRKWGLGITIESNDTTGTSIIQIEDYRVAIALIPAAIPSDEAITAAEHNWFWKGGVEQVKKHKGHVIVSILDAGRHVIKENMLFSKITSAILKHSNSIGVYIGSRSLAIEKEFYISQVETMSYADLPIYIWIYFGLRREEDKQSIYTYGLQDFGKKEIEILDSDNEHGELIEMMFNLSHYVIAHNVDLKDGETIGYSAEQKLKISESPGVFLEGNTLKIKY